MYQVAITLDYRHLSISDKQALSETSPPMQAYRWTERSIL
jgi:hypothetical protein